MTAFRGSFTALATPFRLGSLDESAFRKLVDWQIGEGADGLVPAGTTGESPTLSDEEHYLVVEWCVDQSVDRVPVIAGTGSNSTSKAIELSMQAARRRALLAAHWLRRPHRRSASPTPSPSSATSR
jgi:4-hydroxy-tetrahydrodipicolinate synthase